MDQETEYTDCSKWFQNMDHKLLGRNPMPISKFSTKKTEFTPSTLLFAAQEIYYAALYEDLTKFFPISRQPSCHEQCKDITTNNFCNSATMKFAFISKTVFGANGRFIVWQEVSI
jgi:hypothetical protein